MKLTMKEYAKMINAFADEYPDAIAVYSIDAEGNAFFPVNYEPCAGRLEGNQFFDDDGEMTITHVCIN